MRNRIYLGTQSTCVEFCNKACSLSGDIILTDETGKYRVNAKSILGCLVASADWGDTIWVESENDYYSDFEKWIIDQADDAANIHR